MNPAIYTGITGMCRIQWDFEDKLLERGQEKRGDTQQ